MPNPNNHQFSVALFCSGLQQDTIQLKMPKWTPGYYQLMNYVKAVSNFGAKDANGKAIAVTQANENTWQIAGQKNKAFTLSYQVTATKQFVAESFLDSTHAYLLPGSLFVYANGNLNTPVSVNVVLPKQWKNIATGLEPVVGKSNAFLASDFDKLYDSPLLIGNLEELPSFQVNGIEHRFVGYKPGAFDRSQFMQNLKKVVTAAVGVIGDIPYKQYMFIAIGPGRGGIEHLNNTTISFDGKDVTNEGGMNRMMNFLAHEYFHHYNVKRVRPLELGPFDYDRENRTNLLWVSEGLSVYYEYMVVKRAGLIDERTLLNDFENNINAFENDPGRLYQSLVGASYETWSDGPFGNGGQGGDSAISYYDKGPVVGLLLDFAIRHASGNKGSLDDVMRLLYWHYYKGLSRGFTDAEFQQACESVAGVSLSFLFDYVYTTKELDYATYLSYAGLKATVETDSQTGKRKFTLRRVDNMSPKQLSILNAWLGKQ